MRGLDFRLMVFLFFCLQAQADSPINSFVDPECGPKLPDTAPIETKLLTLPKLTRKPQSNEKEGIGTYYYRNGDFDATDIDTVCQTYGPEMGIMLQCAILKYPNIKSFLWYVSENAAPDALTETCERVLKRLPRLAYDPVNNPRGFKPEACSFDGAMKLLAERGMSLQLAYEPKGDLPTVSAALKDPESQMYKGAKLWAERLAAFPNVPVKIRPMSEMNLPGSADSPWPLFDKKGNQIEPNKTAFVSAWNSLRTIFSSASNIKMVFSVVAGNPVLSAANQVAITDVLKQIGQEKIDYVGVNAYPSSELDHETILKTASLKNLVEPWAKLFKKALGTAKPLVVTEAGILNSDHAKGFNSETRAQWYADAIKYYHDNPDLVGLTFFDSNAPDDSGKPKYTIDRGSSLGAALSKALGGN